MNIPEYDGEKPPHIYIKEFNDLLLEKNKFKYKLLLTFINNICETKFKSLLEMKKFNIENIKKENVLKNLDKYKYILEGELNITINEEEYININNDNIIKLLYKCLKSMNYKLFSYNFNNQTFLTIIIK